MLIRVLYGHALQSTFEAWCVGVTSSRGQGGPVLLRMYPYPTRGAAGPVSGARRGRQGGRADPSRVRHDKGGSRVKRAELGDGISYLTVLPTNLHIHR